MDVDTRKKISKSQQGQYSKPTEAEHFVNKHGADIVRLWVSSVNFTDEVPFGEEMFDASVGNVPPPAQHAAHPAGQPGGFRPGAATRSAPEQFTFVDRWIMHRLQEVIATCREAYAAFEFHKVYHTLNQFCAVDLSSLYVDITKDRMYCDRPGQPAPPRDADGHAPRCSTRCAGCSRRCVRSRRRKRGTTPGSGTSVHLELFPERDERSGRRRASACRSTNCWRCAR